MIKKIAKCPVQHSFVAHFSADGVAGIIILLMQQIIVTHGAALVQQQSSLTWGNIPTRLTDQTELIIILYCFI